MIDDEEDDCDDTNLDIWYSDYGFSWLSRDTLWQDFNLLKPNDIYIYIYIYIYVVPQR